MPPTRKRKPAAPAVSDDTERRILDAARVVFVREGTAGARMHEIAREAGVNQALLHYYFRSKERLAEAVFHHIAEQILPRVFGILGSDATIEDKVDRFVQVYLDAFTENPFLPGYILSELHHHPARLHQLLMTSTGERPARVARPALERLGAQIDALVRAGTIRPITPQQFTVNLVSLCVFPFAARPLLGVILGIDDDEFRRFIAKRKRDLPAFFLSALRP